MTDNNEELVIKLAKFELKHWDECMLLTVRSIIKQMRTPGGIIPDDLEAFLETYKPNPFEKMSKSGQNFHKDHARKVLELIKENE